MKSGKIALVIATAFFLLQGLAFAESISGNVVSVDAVAQTITVSQTDDATGATTETTVAVGDTTQYVGVAAPADVMAGDEVSITAETDAESQTLKASSVEVVKE